MWFVIFWYWVGWITLSKELFLLAFHSQILFDSTLVIKQLLLCEWLMQGPNHGQFSLLLLKLLILNSIKFWLHFLKKSLLIHDSLVLSVLLFDLLPSPLRLIFYLLNSTLYLRSSPFSLLHRFSLFYLFFSLVLCLSLLLPFPKNRFPSLHLIFLFHSHLFHKFFSFNTLSRDITLLLWAS